MTQRKISSITTAAVLAAAALAVSAWVLALASSPVTNPQPMAWHKADGSPPTVATGSSSRFRGCTLADINLDIAVWNDGAIVPCNDEALGAGWAFLDPRTQQAVLRWPLPRKGDVLLTNGLVPGPGGQLAIVFQQAIAGDTFVGIAGPQGWARAPDIIGRVRYLAGAWVDNRLELAVVPLGAEDRHGGSAGVKLMAIEGGERRERVAIPACGTGCRTPQLAYRAGGRWVFEDNGRAVVEGGAPTTPAFPGRLLETRDLEGVAQGRLQAPDALVTGLKDVPGIGADGQPSQAAPPPWSGLRVVRQNRFTIDDPLHRRPQWGDASLRAITEALGDRVLTWYTDSGHRLHVTDARQPAIDAMAALPAVAQWPQGLASRTFVPDATGGVWLVDSAGESIHLDATLRRTDALSLRQHLLSSGSTIPVYALGWALFGLPILLVVCVGLSLCLAPRRPMVRARPLQFAALLYLASAGAALAYVVRLL